MLVPVKATSPGCRDSLMINVFTDKWGNEKVFWSEWRSFNCTCILNCQDLIVLHFFKICKHLIIKHYCYLPKCLMFYMPTWQSLSRNTVRQRFLGFIFTSQLGFLKSLGRVPTPITAACYTFQRVNQDLPRILATGTPTTVRGGGGKQLFYFSLFKKLQYLLTHKLKLLFVHLQLLTTCPFPSVDTQSGYHIKCVRVHWRMTPVTPYLFEKKKTPQLLRANGFIPDVQHWVIISYHFSNWKNKPRSSVQV